jgi:hypothetical protein
MPVGRTLHGAYSREHAISPSSAASSERTPRLGREGKAGLRPVRNTASEQVFFRAAFG